MNKFLVKFSFILICLGMLSAHVSAQTNSANTWQLVYENNEVGKPVQGSKEALIQAIRNGQSIRIAWFHQHPLDSSRKVEHLADAKFLTILSNQHVMAQIDPIIGQTPNFEDQEVIFKENLEWSLIASTTGKNDHMMRNVVSGEIVSHSTNYWGTKWYVKE